MNHSTIMSLQTWSSRAGGYTIRQVAHRHQTIRIPTIRQISNMDPIAAALFQNEGLHMETADALPFVPAHL
jgi:hypothetical protein